MPDIREILQALDIDDRALWSEQRTIMRRSYLNAHNETVGVALWTHEDDAFMDLIDIRLALLFDRAGRLNTTHDIIGSGEATEQALHEAEDKMKIKTYAPTGLEIARKQAEAGGAMSEATKLLQEGFSSASDGWGLPK